MGGVSSSEPTPTPAADPNVRVVCPRCQAMLIPPAAVFRCPCGQTMRLPTGPPVILPSSSSILSRRSRSSLQSGRLEERILFLMERLPPTDPHAIFLAAVLQRLPRRPDGSVDASALESVLRQFAAESRGAPQALIDLLPTRVFHKKTTTAPASTSVIASVSAASSSAGADGTTTTGASSSTDSGREDLIQCMVCLSDFEEGETLRTLPCLHSFHQSCIDTWFREHRDCPLCKMPIDIDQERVLMEQLEGDMSKAASKDGKRGKAGTSGPAGTTDATTSGSGTSGSGSGGGGTSFWRR